MNQIEGIRKEQPGFELDGSAICDDSMMALFHGDPRFQTAELAAKPLACGGWESTYP